MFGLFKKKILGEDELFQADLARFAVDFNPVMRAIDPQGVEEMLQRAFNNYHQRTPEESGYNASDFYFDAFTGAMFELMEKKILPPHVALGIFTMVDSFLRGNPTYQTPLVLSLMDTWQNGLIQVGAIEV